MIEILYLTVVDFYLVTNLKREKKSINVFLNVMTPLGPSALLDSTERTRVTRNEITLFLKFCCEVETSVPGKSLVKFSPFD